MQLEQEIKRWEERGASGEKLKNLSREALKP